MGDGCLRVVSGQALLGVVGVIHPPTQQAKPNEPAKINRGLKHPGYGNQSHTPLLTSCAQVWGFKKFAPKFASSVKI